MRIVHITPGSGGTFYCENCLRDAALVQTLRRLGHDVIMVPMYLPLFVDSPDAVAADTPVFFGGINVYLQEKLPFFRKTPRWIDRLFDAPWLLAKAARREGSTDAAELGAMTLSMLRGREGNQKKEVTRLATWLKEHARPDIIHISNALLLGLAGELKRTLDAKILCSLQDEDTWLDAMGSPYGERCWRAMSDAARDVDAFVAVSHWFAGQMVERMSLPREKVHVVHLGIEVDRDEPVEAEKPAPAIGYLSRVGECHGFGRLVEAFINLKKDPAFGNLRLRATGGVTSGDEPFVSGLRQRLAEAGCEKDMEILPDFQQEARRAFLQSLSVLSVPVIKGEAFGSFILEALAQGVPVVQPRAGAFPEVVEATGGGVVYDPHEEGALERALSGLLLDPARARALGEQGRKAVHERFTIECMAQNLAALYGTLTGEEGV